MVRAKKGFIELKKSEYKNLKKEENFKGKEVFTHYTKEKGRFFTDKSEFEKLAKTKKKLPVILEELKTTKHYLKRFMKKEYDTPNFRKVRGLISKN